MVELALGACLYNGHVQMTLLNNFVFDEVFIFYFLFFIFYFWLKNPHFEYIIISLSLSHTLRKELLMGEWDY